MNIEPDQEWFDALAGRKQPGAAGVADDLAVREGLALRSQIAAALRVQQQAADQEEPANEPLVDADREIALIARARAQGLLPLHGPKTLAPPRNLRKVSATRQLGRLAVAAVLLVAVVAGSWKSWREPASSVRGTATGTLRINDPNPAVLQRELQQELTAAGLRVTAFTRLGRLGLDADLPTPVPSAVRDILARHRLPIPTDGILSVEIDAAGP
jgi:hypothetical protein